MASLSKDKGNAFFKAGEWAEAVGHYSAAILVDQSNPTLPLNRAAAYLKLGKNIDAERDCTTVLALDPSNVKARFRRAQARLALENYQDSERDLLDALKLEPANDSVKKELAIVQARKSDAEKKNKSGKRQPISVPLITSSSQHPQAPKRRVTRNVPIEIVEPGPDPESASASTPARSAFLTPVESRAIKPQHSGPPDVSSSSFPAAPSPPTRVGAGIFGADGKKTIIRSPTQPIEQNGGSVASGSQAPAAPVSVPQNSIPQLPIPASSTVLQQAVPMPIVNTSLSSIPGPSTLSPLTTSKVATFPLPQTLFAFTRAWNALPTPHERFSLLQQMPPYSLSPLFKNGLEPEMLISLIMTLRDVLSAAAHPPQSLLPYLCTIPAIARFETVLKFLSPREKEVIREIWELMEVGGSGCGVDGAVTMQWEWVKRAWGFDVRC
ncbi:hypothetical protein BU17DRAFT_92437 [Hysterangium stoloniferum]|nr:hypothetical protein BU17DRAFT_92437 [Hysterangium stoloniferum]